jgi:hypothetical protein
VVPVALAFVSAEKASDGAVGAVVSTCTSCERVASTLPTLSTAANLTVDVFVSVNVPL